MKTDVQQVAAAGVKPRQGTKVDTFDIRFIYSVSLAENWRREILQDSFTPEVELWANNSVMYTARKHIRYSKKHNIS